MTPKEEIKAKVKAIAEEPIATATVLVINENGEHIYTICLLYTSDAADE